MANGPTPGDSTTEKKPKAKRGEGVVKLRPAYIVYTVNEDGTLTIHSATRKAEAVLADTAGQTEKKYARFML